MGLLDVIKIVFIIECGLLVFLSIVFAVISIKAFSINTKLDNLMKLLKDKKIQPNDCEGNGEVNNEQRTIRENQSNNPGSKPRNRSAFGKRK